MEMNDVEQEYRRFVRYVYSPHVERAVGMSADGVVDMLLDLIDERIERAPQENKPARHTLCGDAETMAAIKSEADKHKSLGQVAYEAMEERSVLTKSLVPDQVPWHDRSALVRSKWESAAAAVASKVRHGCESRIATMAEMLEEANDLIASYNRGDTGVMADWLDQYRKWKDGR